MITFGVEGTAHTLGIGVVDDQKILADQRAVYTPKKGIHPREASRFIAENMKKVLDDTINEASIDLKEIDLYCFSQGPGMGPCLRTVATAARTLALHHKKPLLGVNHCVAHIEIGKRLCKFKDPLTLYVSGGNTQILKKENNRYRIFGETLDIGVGNMLDKYGRTTGLNNPSGPEIEKLAAEGKKFIEMPYSVKGTDLSFSGILTNAEQKYTSGKYSNEDLCFSLQENAFAMLTEVTERALAHLKAKELLLVGGVGNNNRLKEMLSLMSEEHDTRFCLPKGYCSDNGVMIALTGELMHKAGVRMRIEDSIVKQRYRTDDVDVLW